MADGGTSREDIGRRLIALRTALGLNQSAMAQMLGFGQTALANYEKGFRRPDIDQAMAIVRKTGVTLDWIYLGERAGLPLHLAQKLETSLDASREVG